MDYYYLAKLVSENEQIYFAASSILLSTLVIPQLIVLTRRLILIRRFNGWILQKCNHNISTSDFCMAYIVGITSHSRLWPFGLNKKLYDLIICIDLDKVKNIHVRSCLKQYHENNESKIPDSLNGWSVYMKRVLKKVYRKHDLDWVTPKMLLSRLSTYGRIKLYPIGLVLLAIAIYPFYAGCVYYVDNYYIQDATSLTELPAEDDTIRNTRYLDNSNFKLGDRYWSVEYDKSNDNVRPSIDSVDSTLILHTPSDSRISIRQSNIRLLPARHHNYYINVSYNNKTTDNSVAIKLRMVDQVQGTPVEFVFTPKIGSHNYQAPLQEVAGVFLFEMTQEGTGSNSNMSTIAYDEVSITAELKPGIIACTIYEPKYWSGPQYKDFSGGRGDVNYYKVWEYDKFMDSYIPVYPSYQLSKLSRETYIDIENPGIYRVALTFGGITIDMKDSVEMNSVKGVALRFVEDVYMGHLKIKLENYTQKDTTKLYYSIYSSEGYVRGYKEDWLNSYDSYINKNGENNHTIWLLHKKLEDEYYYLRLHKNGSIIYEHRIDDYKAEKHAEETVLTLSWPDIQANIKN